MSEDYRAEQHRPAYRRLRVFAFDPSLGVRFDTSVINETVLKVRWELDLDGGGDGPAPGPVGEYLEVIDYDPASGVAYAPVDLNEPYLLASDGLAPSEGNPQFHQQMVYAVAMTTISNFEQALGRVALWACRKIRHPKTGKTIDEKFVRRLRIYPHALREANAYYSPDKKALLFGYFPQRGHADHEPGQMVFTCLSHDIIAHETTHALLDGIHPRFAEATNPDVLALHEAFSDLVALFQHFSNPDVVRHQIAHTRGDLNSQNLLGQLAQQFGEALGHRAALRDALGGVDKETGEWKRSRPDPGLLEKTTESHARGAILVAAVFDAFLKVYSSRVADLFRIASADETGASDDLHPDLLARLAREAARTAHHLQQMCIRALDYCPPMDVTFSDYLRAIITADHDLHPDDEYLYRVAIIEAFRQHGIVARYVRGMSEETLVWPSGIDALMDAGYDGDIPLEPTDQGEPPKVDLRKSQQTAMRALFISTDGSKDAPVSYADELWVGWDLDIDRELAWKRMRDNQRIFHRWLTSGPGKIYIDAFGLTVDENAPPSVFRSKTGLPAIEVHSVRTAVRRGERGTLVTELVVEITQRRRGYYDRDEQVRIDSGEQHIEAGAEGDFKFRRGCTVLIDPQTLAVRRVIRTRGTILDDRELERVRAHLTGERPNPPNAFDAGPLLHDGLSFARLHRLT